MKWQLEMSWSLKRSGRAEVVVRSGAVTHLHEVDRTVNISGSVDATMEKVSMGLKRYIRRWSRGCDIRGLVVKL